MQVLSAIRVMATVLQFGAKASPRGSHLDPALKEFLDEVVIPALVKAYLLESEGENRLAKTPNDVTHCRSEHSLSTEGVL